MYPGPRALEELTRPLLGAGEFAWVGRSRGSILSDGYVDQTLEASLPRKGSAAGVES
jgi:hypothetical protein